MDPRFSLEISAINQGIATFNQYLNPAFKVPAFNSDTMVEEKHCIKILHGRWDDFGFPNSSRRGVYFIFGHEKTNNAKNGLYIGKSSFTQAMGKRLDSWLRPHKKSDFFEMNCGNEQYRLDYMASIDLDSLNLGFMASALEEHLITVLKDDINLMNGTGNKRKIK